MAGDAFKKVKGNDPLEIPAATYNAFIDAAMDLANRRLNTARGNPGRGGAASVLISNQTGGDLAAFAVVGLDTPIFAPNVEDAEITETFKQQAGFNGVTPASPTHVGKFAVLREPTPSGAIGQAMVAGVTAVKVNFTDADHAYADVADGVTAYLASGESGSAKVLWKEAGTGTLWAMVLLGVGGGGVGEHTILNDGETHTDTDAEAVTPAEDDLLYRKAVGSELLWSVLAAAGPAVLAYDAANGLRWLTAATDYLVLQRKADDTIAFDWVRAHG